VHSPLWLNILGIFCALVSLFADDFRLKRQSMNLIAFAAVTCFGISGVVILRALRRLRKIRAAKPE
jgi:hypothetical protein